MKYCDEQHFQSLSRLLTKYSMQLVLTEKDEIIPGSFWGDSEAGLIENRLYVRADTPVHSALHEACHYICMDDQRRDSLHTDAGGGYDEENGVCYLQILLSDFLEGIGKEQIFTDMDEWGYSFRLGSTRDWFNNDAEDAQEWLISHYIIDQNDKPTWQLRH